MPDHTKQDHLPSCCFYQFFFSRLHRRNSSQSRLHLCFIYCFDLLLPRSAEVAEVPSNFGKGVVINSSHFRHQAVFIAGNWSSSPSILQEWRNVLGASAMTFLLLIFIKIVETVYHLSEKKRKLLIYLKGSVLILSGVFYITWADLDIITQCLNTVPIDVVISAYELNIFGIFLPKFWEQCSRIFILLN